MAKVAPYKGVRVSPANRPPRANDDSAHGYVAGNYWQYTGQVWLCQDATNNKASWTKVTLAANGHIVDMLGGPATSAYGCVKLVKAYAGACIQIRETAGGTTQDIGFDANDRMDSGAIDEFLNAHGAAGTLVKIYDQSGNALDAAALTGVHGSSTFTEPSIGFRLVNGARVLSITTDVPGGVLQGFSLPVGHSIDARNSSVVFIADHPNTGMPSVPFWFGTGSPNSLGVTTGASSVNPNDGPYVYKSGGNTKTSIPCPAGVSIMSLEASATACVYRHNEGSASLSAAPVATITGGGLGYQTFGGFYGGRFDFLAMFVMPRTLTSVERGTIWPWFYTRFNVTPQFDTNIVYVGDSIEAGSLVKGGRVRSQLIEEKLGEPFRRYNCGVPGKLASACDADFATYTAPLYIAGKTNIVHLQPGTNDIGAGGLTGATAWAYIVSMAAKANAAGFKTIIRTISQRNDGFATQIGNFNALARTVGPTLPGVIGISDSAADAILGAVGAAANTALFPDGLHESAYAHEIEVSYDAPIIFSVLPKL